MLAVALILALATAAAAAPRPSSTLKQKKEELGQVRRQLDAARARASAARSREVSLLAELEQMDRTLARKRAELRRLDARIGRVEAELDALGDRRGRVAEDLVAQQADLGAHLGALAALRARPVAPGWAGERAEAVRARALDDLARVTRVDLARLTDFGETAERLSAREQAVARGRRELVALRRAVEAERSAVNREAERRRVLLADVRDDRATHERMAAELEEASRRLEALVRALSRRVAARPAAVRPAEPSAPRPPAVGLGTLRGQLPWPTDGRIAAGFGRQVHPRFGTETFRRGVDIEAEEGAPIRAVYGGTVLYRGWLKGYGNLIILDHGVGYYTLYAHASELLVAEGDRVKAGQGIARVGETGSLAGPRLYFEIRYEGRPEDPEQWLRRRS
ncbi:MAG: peptidoglycan DD-metalloendopeptidase family protein [Candidatus Rokubacteria bacterium]|nr:peptidoglycan DD-metalloendopeptidase family protein [Candidatus Rokubacteria bacterium]